MRDLSPIFNVFFGYEKFGSRYDVYKEWAKTKFGENDELYKILNEDHVWIKDLVDFRNAVEHPESSKLKILNIEPHKSGKLDFPKWSLNDQTQRNIINDIEVFVENMLTFCEDILVILIKKTLTFPHIIFLEIPENDRDENCPIRIRASIDKSKLGVAKND